MCKKIDFLLKIFVNIEINTYILSQYLFITFNLSTIIVKYYKLQELHLALSCYFY